MKQILVFLVLASGFLYGTDKVYELNVANMSCGGCAKNIKNTIAQIAPVKDMQADFKTKDVNLTISEHADINLILLALKLKKYDVKLVK